MFVLPDKYPAETCFYTYHVRGDFCRLLINFDNSLAPDQDRQIVGPVLWEWSARNFLKKFNLKKVSRWRQKREELPSMQSIKVCDKLVIIYRGRLSFGPYQGKSVIVLHGNGKTFSPYIDICIVDIILYSGPSGIFGSDWKQNTAWTDSLKLWVCCFLIL